MTAQSDAIEPATKMLMRFEESGRSPLVDVLPGNSEELIAAMWQYFRIGRSMKIPPGLGAAPAKPGDHKGFNRSRRVDPRNGFLFL